MSKRHREVMPEAEEDEELTEGVDLSELLKAIKQTARELKVDFLGKTVTVWYNPAAIPSEQRVQFGVSKNWLYPQAEALVSSCVVDWDLVRNGRKVPLKEIGKLPSGLIEAIFAAIVMDLQPNPPTPAS